MEFRIALTIEMSSTVPTDGVKIIINGCVPRKKGVLKKSFLLMVIKGNFMLILAIHKCKETNV